MTQSLREAGELRVRVALGAACLEGEADAADEADEGDEADEADTGAVMTNGTPSRERGGP